MRVSVPKEPTGRLSDAWRYCVGTGRFELALRRDYQDSLALVQREIGFRHIRGHGLLSDGVGVYRPYEYQGARRVHHSFTYVDQVVDAYLDLGIKPFLELGFMPVTDYAAAPAGHTVALSIPLDTPQGTAFTLRSSVSEEAGNAWAAWSAMGRPRSPDRRQLDALRELAEPARRHQVLPIADGRLDLDLTLDRHEVTLVEITPVTDETPPWWDEDRLLGTGRD